MNALNEYLERLDEHIGKSRRDGSHQQYIEGLLDALDILKDVLE